MIIDYSVVRPSIATLKRCGVSAVGRYLGWDSVPGYISIGKNVTKAEAQGLIAAGIQLFLVFEYDPNAAAHGKAQGSADGLLADVQMNKIGAPPTMAVYFAVDFDIPDYAPHLEDIPSNAIAKLGPVGEYFQAIREHGYPYEVGVYGGYYAVRRLLDSGLVTKAWQTTAWSEGQLDSRVVLYQVQTPADFPDIFGTDTDVRVNGITVEDFGQWPRPHNPVKPIPAQEEDMPIVLEILARQEACVLPVPAGKGKVTLYADPGFGPGHVDPVIRVGTAPTWNGGVNLEPTWDKPAELDLPVGTTAITVGRVDNGDTIITVDFS